MLITNIMHGFQIWQVYTLITLTSNISFFSHNKFLSLGGRTEYIVTIACVIGRSRMKGERIVTNLLPYPPEKPRFLNSFLFFMIKLA